MSLATFSFLMAHPLASRHRVRALGRWAGWQAWSRTVGTPRAVAFANESRLWVAPGMTGATGNLYAGLHEFEDMAFVLHALRPSDLFVDVGANVGSYTVLAGAAIGARCESFEPVPSTFAHLQRNVDLNGMQARVQLHQAGVGREPGTLRFSADEDTTNHVVAEGEGVSVPVVTLDDAIQEDGPLVLKMDVEGWETEALAGARRLLDASSPRALVLELNGSGERYGFDDADLHRDLLARGYAPFAYHPFRRSLENLGDRISDAGNTLYLNDAPFFRARVASAPPFRVFGERI